MRLFPLIALASALALIPEEGIAALIHDESVDGDIGGDTFTFDAGVNEIVGTLHFDSSQTDTDIFLFSLPEGYALLGVTYSFSGIELIDETRDLAANFMIKDPGYTDTCVLKPIVNVATSGPGSVLYDSCDEGGSTIEFDFTGGTWLWDHGLLRTTAGGGSWDYTLAFEVQGVSVPEPGGFVLLCAGIFGLAAVRRITQA